MATTPSKGRAPAAKPADALETERDQLRTDLSAAADQIAELRATLAESKDGQSLIARIAEAMDEAAEVTKDRVNGQQGYKYASAEAMLKAVRGPLFRRSIILSAHVVTTRHEQVQTTTGKPMRRTTVLVDFTFHDGLSEHTHTVRDWEGVGEDSGDKGIGKAYTSAIKTFIRTQWLLPTEHDDPEREGPAAPPRLPAWADPINPEEATSRIVDWLGPIVSPHNASIIAAKLTEQTGGGVPRIALDVVNMVRRAHDALQPAPEPTPPDVAEDVARQAVAGEAPDEHPVNVPEKPASIPHPLETIVTSGGELPTVPLQIKAMRDAGCICPSPLEETPTEKYDEVCPIIGHGVPF